MCDYGPVLVELIGRYSQPHGHDGASLLVLRIVTGGRLTRHSDDGTPHDKKPQKRHPRSHHNYTVPYLNGVLRPLIHEIRVVLGHSSGR